VQIYRRQGDARTTVRGWSSSVYESGDSVRYPVPQD